ncbi:MAG: DUF2184 domain-containing protein [Pseudomonadota bacterium]
MPNRFDEDVSAIKAQTHIQHMDANETVFFARQLEYIRPKIYDVKRPQLSALTTFPIDTAVPEWAESVTYTMYDATGIAKIISSYADDLPMVGINGKQFTSRVKSLGDAYGWSTAEIRAAAATNTPLQSKLATMAKRGHDIAVNKIAWFGDANANLQGFLSNTNIPVYVTPADGTGSSKLWTTKTADQITRDMSELVNLVKTQSLGIHVANELWMPLDEYTLISTKVRGTTANPSADSILKVFQINNPGVTVKPILELADVATYSSLNVMVAIENSVENLQLVLPMAFREYPPQANNLSWKVPCESRIGGVTIEYPFAMAITSGI